MLDDDRLISILKYKEKKLVRHKRWAKRHKRRMQQERKQLTKRNEKWVKETEWTVTLTPSSFSNNSAASNANKSIEDDVDKEANKLTTKIKELSRIMSKLTQLRDLRRRKLESKGHFFAEDGNQFFNQVEEWHKSNQVKQQKDKNEEYESINIKPSKKLTINKEDTWKHMSIDKKAYSYWCASDQSLEVLLKNRRMWDQYILFDSIDNDIIHKVPPTFVIPAPPANSIWASYLF